MPLPTNPGRDPVAGRYTLVLHDRLTGRYTCSDFACLEELAKAVYSVSSDRYHGGFCQFDLPVAYSTRGNTLDTVALEAYGRRLYRESSRYWFGLYPGYVRRAGPVHGIRKWRGGGHYFRRFSTTAERRQGALVVREDGEVAPRAARNPRNLPNAWDDYPHGSVERNWKSQHKGRKAWDR